jgi:hypothetical protein
MLLWDFILDGHALHLMVQVSHPFLVSLLAEVLLTLAELGLRCMVIARCLKLLLTVPHIMLRRLSMLEITASTEVILDHFLNDRVI